MPDAQELVVTPQPHLADRCVLMWKSDGLCQRIAATIHGLVIASEFDMQFKLTWVDAQVMMSRFEREYVLPNDTPQDPALIFAQDFLDQYLIADVDINYPPELSPQAYSHADALGRKEIIMNTQRDYDKAAADKVFFGLAPDPLDEEFISDHDAKCRAIATPDIFSDEIKDLFAKIDANTALKSMWAVHLRGGDVVYGEIRKLYARRQELSMTVPVAIDVCRHAEELGKQVVVLGATKHEIDFVLSQCPNAVSARHFDLHTTSGATAVIGDAILMSRCERLISGKKSAVVLLATYLGNPEWTEIAAFYEEGVEADVIKSALARDEIAACHDLQKAFVYYTLFVLDWKHGSFEDLDSYLQKAYELDPETLSYLVLQYLNCLSFSKFGLANRKKAEFLRLAAVSGGTGGRNMTGHAGIRSDFMEEFMRHIDCNEDLPDGDARRIRGWIERFYDTDV